MMTDGEIITSYKQAKDHKKQIGVLADLNGCALAEMETKLTALGLIRATPAPSFDYLRAAELYAEGKSDLEIAEQLGAGKASVVRWRKSKDLAANYPKKRAPAGKKPPSKKTPAVKKAAPRRREPTPASGGALRCQTVAQFKILAWLAAQGVTGEEIAKVTLLGADRVRVANPAGQYLELIYAGGRVEIDQTAGPC